MKYLILFLVTSLLYLGGCRKDEPLQHEVLRKLYEQNSSGEISECWLNNQKVYCLSQLVFDGGTIVYNESGNKIGTCNYAWGPIDSICKNLDSCEVIYRPKNNMFNWPFIDKYGLSKQ
jgi:hypothetical protein